MADNRKYYYLKLKENFFDSDEMVILESMPDGYLYSNILLKLYLRSLKYDGRLMFNDKIPFNSEMLANVTRHSVGVVEKAMRVFRDLGLIEVMDSGAIYITDIQNFIGESSTEADRKRRYRARIAEEKKALPMGHISGHMSDKAEDKSPPEIELDIEIEKELEIDNIFTPISLVFEHWNAQNIIKHRTLNDKIKRSISSALKSYTEEELIQAITNYAQIVNGKKYYFNYKWTLGDFLKRGIDKFMDWAVAADNYLIKDKHSRGEKVTGEYMKELLADAAAADRKGADP